jgi:hypothetical protein
MLASIMTTKHKVEKFFKQKKLIELSGELSQKIPSHWCDTQFFAWVFKLLVESSNSKM